MGLGTLRNKPCPCGSGLKAKYCCLPTLYVDEKDRVCKERAEAEKENRIYAADTLDINVK